MEDISTMVLMYRFYDLWHIVEPVDLLESAEVMMAEQRLQAYIELVGQLVHGPHGQEGDLLQAHKDLLDPGFPATIDQAAATVRQQGHQNAAVWLQNLAMQQAMAMGVSLNSPNKVGKLFPEVGQLITQILQCIAENQGAAEPVYQFLAANQAQLNTELLQTFPSAVSAILGNFDSEQKLYVAAVIATFGNLIQQFPLGQRAVNMELAIVAYEQSLQVMTRESMPVEWARSMMNLATAYSDRIRGDRAQNIKQALLYYEQVLTVFSRRTHPLDWAKTQQRLGQLHKDPTLGQYDKAAQTLEDAYQFLLRRKLDLVLLADVMFQLAQTYHILGQLEQARLLLKDALRLYNRMEQPAKATATLATLGNLEMQTGRIAHATQHLQSALVTYQAEGRPERIAEVEKLLGFLAPS